jgi:hypothetical protein
MAANHNVVEILSSQESKVEDRNAAAVVSGAVPDGNRRLDGADVTHVADVRAYPVRRSKSHTTLWESSDDEDMDHYQTSENSMANSFLAVAKIATGANNIQETEAARHIEKGSPVPPQEYAELRPHSDGKKCSKCKKVAGPSEFISRKKGVNLVNQCIRCREIKTLSVLNRRVPDGSFRCNTCSKVLALESFQTEAGENMRTCQACLLAAETERRKHGVPIRSQQRKTTAFSNSQGRAEEEYVAWQHENIWDAGFDLVSHKRRDIITISDLPPKVDEDADGGTTDRSDRDDNPDADADADSSVSQTATLPSEEATTLGEAGTAEAPSDADAMLGEVNEDRTALVTSADADLDMHGDPYHADGSNAAEEASVSYAKWLSKTRQLCRCHEKADNEVPLFSSDVPVSP